MNKILFYILILVTNSIFAQTDIEIKSLLITISKVKDSKEISKSKSFIKLSSFGTKALPILQNNFSSSSITDTFSECIERNLTLGEIAIISADLIERMPYFVVTGVQNCTLSFCDNNPNKIEYYLEYINGNNFTIFNKKYSKWLTSKDRKDWNYK